MRITLTPNDFQYDWFSGTGAGGQHRNKHQNCLRLTHIETGITVTAQQHRTRTQNKADAYKAMAISLKEHYSPKSIMRDNEEVIRSYKFVNETSVIDHVTGDKISIQSMDDFNLQPILEKKLCKI